MKQIALMGLMAAVVAFGLYGCTEPGHATGDGGWGRELGGDWFDTGPGAEIGDPIRDDYSPDGGVALCGDAICIKSHDCRCGLCKPHWCTGDDDCNPGQICTAKVCRDSFLVCPRGACEIEGQKCIAITDEASGVTKTSCHYESCGEGGACPAGTWCFNTFCVAEIPCGGGCPADKVCLTDRNECIPVPAGCDVTCNADQIRVFKEPGKSTYSTCEKIECSCESPSEANAGVDGGADAGLDGALDAGQDAGQDGGAVCDANCPTSEMVTVPAGSFQMGCNTAVDTECRSNENPYHAVSVPAFKIDKYELTVGEYQACVDAGVCSHHFDDGTCYVWNGSSWTQGVLPQTFRDASKPVVCVEWAQAKTYCTWAGKRLPTEAEWEKAARGTDGRKYPWGDATLDCNRAVHSANGCSNSSTAPVGSKPLGVSPYGAEDMVGNVYEWVEDWYHDTYTGAPADGSAWVTPTGSYRVVRGGSWYYFGTTYLRASNRNYLDPSYRYSYLGFRCGSFAQ